MKKRLFILCLVICLLLCALPTGAAAADVCFIAINESLQELTSPPAFVGSVVYVPYWVFASFRIYYSFFASDNIAMVYTEAKQFYFELGSGNTYDGDGNYFSATAVFRNGQVYLPAKFICDQFGLTYSYISGNNYGDIVRICDGSAVLTDERFLSAASTLMEVYYNAYMALIAPPSPSPGVSPTPSAEPDRRSTEVLLSFTGLPSDALLDTLEQYSISACFFLSAEDVLASPDTLRRCVSAGHSLGVLCGADPYADYAETSRLLFDAARISTILCASSLADDSSCRSMASELSLAFVRFTLDAMNGGAGAPSAAAITSQLEFSLDQVSVRFTSGGTTPTILPDILRYLNSNNFSLRPIRETDAAG